MNMPKAVRVSTISQRIAGKNACVTKRVLNARFAVLPNLCFFLLLLKMMGKSRHHGFESKT
jgi:hypothetical protein